VRLQIAPIGEEVLREPANELSCEEIITAKTRELIEHVGGQAGGPHRPRAEQVIFAQRPTDRDIGR
jgi:hypothetical protein